MRLLGVRPFHTARGDNLSATTTLARGTTALPSANGAIKRARSLCAARHSRRVRFLRRSIPVAIALILGATVLVSWIDPLKVLVRFPLDAGAS